MNISWIHNNKSIDYIGDILINIIGKKISTLSIDSVQEKHSGVFTCIATNWAGTDSHSAQLHVNGIL